jgi:hypothetical protein
MSNNNESWSINFDTYFILCIAFTIVGVWFPDYIMWVVWAFVGWVALMVVITIIALIVEAVMVHKATRWF